MTEKFHKFLMQMNHKKAFQYLKENNIIDSNEFFLTYKNGLDDGMNALMKKEIEIDPLLAKNMVYVTSYKMGCKNLYNELTGTHKKTKIKVLIILLIIGLIYTIKYNI